MTKSQLSSKEYNPYYQTYIDKVEDSELLEGLSNNSNAIYTFLDSIAEEKFDYAYAAGKWTIKELLQHIIDTERIFTYRALTFARNDKTALPGYEHDVYAVTSMANIRTKESLLNEYKALRMATLALYKSFSEEMLTTMGNANGSDISVRALGFILIGHENHHCQIIKERYL